MYDRHWVKRCEKEALPRTHDNMWDAHGAAAQGRELSLALRDRLEAWGGAGIRVYTYMYTVYMHMYLYK